MSKIFEDKFSELQADMVAICLEYVENRAEKIFIYGSFEEKVISSDFFYCINGKVVRKHKLNDAINNPIDFQYNTSGERQSGVLNILNNNIKKMIKLCEEYNREMPSEIKLIYNVVNNNLKADFKYGIVYSNQPEKTADDISMEWFEEMQSAL
ncbi:DUF600 domain-containing protein [Shouchella clausii]|uniref:DUF600 domain-containing protein n=1 Tax=Shouchella clausii TaxID=79880 RepID=UPI000BA621BD|nr:DUF600 domain-containing protein [Shouchella clausii]MEB5480469.1 DUF600 domain-containing protein [Shouchella clausii]PAD13901.1 DUF600 domain-containing protein [Shouchella clausii]